MGVVGRSATSSFALIRAGEDRLPARPSQVALRSRSELVTREPGGDTREPYLTIEASSRRVRDDLVGIARQGGAAVELVDPPAVDLVVEAVLLYPSSAKDGVELGDRLRHDELRATSRRSVPCPDFYGS